MTALRIIRWSGHQRHVLVFGTAVLWAASLMLEAIRIEGITIAGWWLLLWGPAGVAFGYVEWLANPVMLYVAITLRSGGSRRFCLSGAMVLAALAVVSLSRSGYPIDASGAVLPVQRLLIGYYLWIGSIGVMIVGLLHNAAEKR